MVHPLDRKTESDGKRASKTPSDSQQNFLELKVELNELKRLALSEHVFKFDVAKSSCRTAVSNIDRGPNSRMGTYRKRCAELFGLVGIRRRRLRSTMLQRGAE